MSYKKCILLLIVVIFHQFNLFSQNADIHMVGVVVEQNSKYNTGKLKKIGKVEVKAPGNITQSNSDGKFDLIFPDKLKNKRIPISIEKLGYELINSKELSNTIIVDETIPLKVVMCEVGKLFENQLAYYNIIDNHYTKKINDLETLNKENEQEKNRLKQLYEDEIRELKLVADKFAIVNLDDVDDLYQKAFTKFTNNDVEGAIKILTDIDLSNGFEDRKALREKNNIIIENSESKIEEAQQANAKSVIADNDAVQKSLLLARMLRTSNNVIDAIKYYQLALNNYIGVNYELLNEFAIFLINQNNYTKAKHTIENYLEINKIATTVENDINQLYKSQVLQHLAGIYVNESNTEAAELHFKNSLILIDELMEKSPNEYIGYKIDNLINQAILYAKQSDFLTSANLLSEAIILFKQAGALGSINLRDFVFLLNNMGLLYLPDGFGLEEEGKAVAYFNIALEITENEIYKKIDQNKSLTDLAWTLNNLGLLNNNIGSANNNIEALNKAKNYYKRAKDVRLSLYEGGFNPILPDLAQSYMSIGLLTYNLNELSEAKLNFNSAIEIYIELSKNEPRAFNYSVAKAYFRSGTVYEKLYNENRIDNIDQKIKGLEVIKLAKDILQEYNQTNPTILHLQNMLNELQFSLEN